MNTSFTVPPTCAALLSISVFIIENQLWLAIQNDRPTGLDLRHDLILTNQGQ